MRDVANLVCKQLTVLVLLIAVDLTISFPIMGATYRPFSWMSIARADAATLYPVLRNVVVAKGMSTFSVTNVAVGAHVVLERTTNLLDNASWSPVASTTTASQGISLIDTNPITQAVFYRVRQILGEVP